MKKIISTILKYLVLGGAAFFFLTPFFWTLFTSLKPNEEIYSKVFNVLPVNIDLTHYSQIVSGSNYLLNYFSNTMIVTVITIIILLLLSSLAGYAYASLEFPGKKIFFIFTFMIITVPLAIYLIPIYMMEDRLNLINTRLGLILPYVAFNLPFSILIMRASFRRIPREIEESAVIDGCNLFQLWYRILLPLVKPGLVVVALLGFINVWGEFMFARTLTNSHVAQTLPVGITFLRDEAAAWQYGTLSAVIILSLIPVAVVFLALQKYLIKAIFDGETK